ncbi:DoxX family protein [Stenotrophomonas maltophilia]|uniref:DoxX family protein n=1 Tax=Stenotrophomonas maltophilia TaxID=40324 RepID=UPI003CCFE062
MLTAVFVGAAGKKLAASEFEVPNSESFGYAPWFMYAVGVTQLLGAAALLFRG